MDNVWARDKDTGLQRLQGTSKKGRDCRALKEVGEGFVLKTSGLGGAVRASNLTRRAHKARPTWKTCSDEQKKEEQTVSTVVPPLHAKLGLKLTTWTSHQTQDPSKFSRR